MSQGRTFQGRIAELRVRYHQQPRSRLFAPLADLLRQAGEVEEALMLLEDGLVRYPDYLSAMIILGQTLFDTGRSSHARRVLQKVLEQDPQNLVALRSLATDAVDQGDLAAAVPLLETLVSQDAADEHWTRTLVRCRRELAGGGELPDTMAEVTAGPIAGPTGEPTAGPAAEPLAAVPVGGAEAQVEPVASSEDESLATMTLIDIYLAQGYRTKALQALHRILARHPDQVDVKRKLAEVETLLGGIQGPEAPGPAPLPGAAGGRFSRDMEKQQFQAWLERLDSGRNGTP